MPLNVLASVAVAALTALEPAKRGKKRKRRRNRSKRSSKKPRWTATNTCGPNETFFGLLCVDELARITHYVYGTSFERRMLNEHYFGTHSPFRTLARATFHTLHLHDQRRIQCWARKGVVELGRHDELDAIKQVLSTVGSGIKRIYLHSCGSQQLFRAQVSDYAALISGYCSKVEELFVAGLDRDDLCRDTIDEFVEAFSSNLRVLDIRGRKMRNSGLFSVLGTTAAGRLIGRSPTLRTFTYRGDNIGHLNILWSIVGASLEEVNLTFFNKHSEWLPTLKALQHHCVVLNSVHLNNPVLNSSVKESEFADFICSFGARLQRARLYSLNDKHLERIVTSCPNLRATFFEKRSNYMRLAVIAPCVQSLALRVPKERDWGSLTRALTKCTRLTSLKLSRRPDARGGYDILHSSLFPIFKTPIAIKLERLDLFAIPTACHLKPLIQYTGRLRSIRLLFEQSSGSTFFVGIADANPLLEEVELFDHEFRSRTETTMYVHEVAECFMRCKNLRKFRLLVRNSEHPDENYIRALELRLRHRKIDFYFEFAFLIEDLTP